MIEPVVQPIFPIPVVLSQLDRDYTEEERKFFVKQNSKQTRNIGNSMSANNYILNEPEMAGLKQEIDQVLKQYLDNVISPVETDVELYITQSWMNWTRPGEWHHKHTHSNSLLSGVFYVSAEEGKDKIVFINDTYRLIKFQIKDINHFNTETWDYTTRTGMLVLFPSWLQHMVEMKPEAHTKTRISLAFNVFVRGTLGKQSSLTELKL
jgi:uncharacterized protein (TIGR02466 family)